MDAGRMLREARRRAGFTQRALAARAGVPQSMVARIESRAVVPRVDTLEKLLNECGETVRAEARGGEGVDRTLIASMLALSPAERLRATVSASNDVARLRATMKR